MNKLALVFTVVLALISTYTFATGDAEKGKIKAVDCAGCHGVDGNTATPDFPKLAGQNASYLVKELQNFKTGARASVEMSDMAALLTDEDMADLAAYYASQKSFIASDKVALGKAKAATCAGCHGVDGNALAPTFPKLAGQSEGYLLKQLKDFKSGARVDGLMAGLVAPLTEKDMADLAAYYATQKVSKGAVMQGANLALGQKIYRGGKKATGVTACIACHGPIGKGIPSAGFPALASQHSMYTVKQLKAFRQHSINAQTGAVEPSRTNDYEGMMINFTKSLTNAEIDAVSAYISGL